VPKLRTIGSVGSAPHIHEIYSYQKCLPFPFILPHAYSPNGNSHLDQKASIDADFIRVVPFWGSGGLQRKFYGSNLPPKIEKKF
jgi:hypothetical protein